MRRIKVPLELLNQPVEREAQHVVLLGSLVLDLLARGLKLRLRRRLLLLKLVLHHCENLMQLRCLSTRGRRRVRAVRARSGHCYPFEAAHCAHASPPFRAALRQIRRPGSACRVRIQLRRLLAGRCAGQSACRPKGGASGGPPDRIGSLRSGIGRRWRAGCCCLVLLFGVLEVGVKHLDHCILPVDLPTGAGEPVAVRHTWR